MVPEPSRSIFCLTRRMLSDLDEFAPYRRRRSARWCTSRGVRSLPRFRPSILGGLKRYLALYIGDNKTDLWILTRVQSHH